MRRKTNGDHEDEQSPFMMNMTPRNSALPSAQELLEIGAVKHGYADKVDTSWRARWLPCMYPQFKKRYFILIGSFLFRYSTDNGDSPKGVPLPMDAITVRIIDSVTFEVSTLRKDYHIRTANAAECAEWVKAIKARKASAIRENMGHVEISPQVASVNRKASKLFQTRIENDRRRGPSGPPTGIESIMNPLQFPSH